MKLYVFHGLQSTTAAKITEAIEINSHNPKLGEDLSSQPFDRFIGQLCWSGVENFYSIANSVETYKDFGLTTYNSNGLGFIFSQWSSATQSLNIDGTWTKLDQYSWMPSCIMPYDFNSYGRFIFGIEFNDGNFPCFLFCENCIIYSPDIRSTTSAIKAYWKDDHSGIQIS
jgi:hypothetical protein